MRFESPWALLLLLLVPLVFWLARRRQGRATIVFPSSANAREAGPSIRQVLMWVPSAMRLVALILLILALARPQKGMEQVHDESKGVAIEMVLDRSSSMGQAMEYEGGQQSRFDVVKSVFRKFIDGDRASGLHGRPNDLIGMVIFAKYADTIAPLTLAHGALNEFLKSTKLVVPGGPEDSTSIGDAVALAAARLRTAEETLARQTGEPVDKFSIKSKAIILLTDGENNSGKRNPIEAARLAKKWGIKLYTIGIGGQDTMVFDDSIFGRRLVRTGAGGAGFDLLKAMAMESGGKAFMAESGDALKKIYREIDRLERSEVKTIRYLDYREMFMPFALASFALVLLEAILSATIFRRIP